MLFAPLAVWCQVGVLTFGLQAKPVVPVSFFEPLTTLDRVPLHGELELKGGLAFGMLVRAGLTKTISLETGINQITRRYAFSVSNDTNGYQGSGSIKYVGYEIPVMGLVYIRLGEKTWMNNALGFSLDMYPSDVVQVVDYSKVYLFRKNWAQFGVVGNIGVEYRTDKHGIFYFGATYHRPFGDMAKAELTWFDRDYVPYTLNTFLDGSYLTADLRYFFHEDPLKAQRRKAQKALRKDGRK